MLPMDCAAAMKVTFLERKQPWLAGHCEVICDWGGALSYGSAGMGALHYQFSPTTVVIFAALGTASEIGTVLGYKLTHRAVA